MNNWECYVPDGPPSGRVGYEMVRSFRVNLRETSRYRVVRPLSSGVTIFDGPGFSPDRTQELLN